VCCNEFVKDIMYSAATWWGGGGGLAPHFAYYCVTEFIWWLVLAPV
jgi:hypothetical protein